MPTAHTKQTKADKRREAIWKQAEEMCVPAWATPLWRATYCKPAKALVS